MASLPPVDQDYIEVPIIDDNEPLIEVVRKLQK